MAAPLDELPTLHEAGLDYIRALADRVDAGLIIIDPLMAFVPDALDTHRDHHSRRLLRKLSALAEDTGATVLVLRHLRKGPSVDAKDAGGGSVGFTAAARVVLLAAVDPEDDTRRVLARVKGNLSAPFASLGYQLVGAGSTVRVEWLGETHTPLPACSRYHSTPKRGPLGTRPWTSCASISLTVPGGRRTFGELPGKPE